jgi:hypothetical protein
MMTSPAGFISDFGKQMQKIVSKSPVDLSRQAKYIATIKLGDPKTVNKFSHNLEQEGKNIIPEGVETLNQSYGKFDMNESFNSASPSPEERREMFLYKLGVN